MATMKTYFIAGGGHIKIGRSINPHDRLKNLQTSCPLTLKLLGVIDGDRESEFHSKFSNFRDSGEWFKADATLLAWIAQTFQKNHSVTKIAAQSLRCDAGDYVLAWLRKYCCNNKAWLFDWEDDCVDFGLIIRDAKDDWPENMDEEVPSDYIASWLEVLKPWGLGYKETNYPEFVLVFPKQMNLKEASKIVDNLPEVVDALDGEDERIVIVLAHDDGVMEVSECGEIQWRREVGLEFIKELATVK